MLVNKGNPQGKHPTCVHNYIHCSAPTADQTDLPYDCIPT